MSTDALGYTIALLAIGMSMVAVKGRNLLLTLGASALWATLLAFVVANLTTGSNTQELFMIAIGTFIIAMVLLGGFRATEGVGNGENEESNPIKRFIHKLNSDSLPPLRGRRGDTPEEYRAMVRKAYQRSKRTRR